MPGNRTDGINKIGEVIGCSDFSHQLFSGFVSLNGQIKDDPDSAHRAVALIGQAVRRT